MERFIPKRWTPLKKLLALHAMSGEELSELTATGNPAAFTSTAAKPLLQCQAAFEPVQSGSGDPSPENVRPITGWTGVNVWHSGTNVWDEQWEQGALDSSSGGTKPSTVQIRSKNYIPVVAGATYYGYCGALDGQSSSSLVVNYYDANKNFVQYGSGINGTTKTIPSGVSYIKFWTVTAYGGTYLNDITINYPATDTTYHAYTGAAYPVTFPAVGKNLLKNTLSTTTLPNGITATVNADKSITLTGTSSGTGSLQIGTISLPVGGYTALKAVSNDVYINIAGVTNIYDTNKSFSVTSAISDRSVSIQIKSGVTLNDTIYPQIEAGYTATAYEPYTNTIYGGYVDLVTGVLTATDAVIASYNGEILPSTWISDCDVYAAGTTPTTGAQVVYKLATPLTYQLTPQQITALVGANNIWSDANGDMTIKYLSKGA